jgi:TolA-binding protein
MRAAELDVQRLLSEVLMPGADRELLRPVAREPVRPRPVLRRLRPMLVVAATLFVAGVAAAAGWQGMRMIQERTTALSGAVSPPAPPAPASDLGPAVRARAAAPAIIVAPPPPASPSPPPLEVVALVPQATGLAAAQRVSPPAPLPLHEPAFALAAAASQGPPALPSSAALLFERANRARRSGDHSRASELYRALQGAYPASVEAHETDALLGRLLLEDGDALSALRSFDAYLRDGGSLQEDVMADRATALARLGRATEEAEAWKALLSLYPASVHADRARGRLRELTGVR